MIDLKSDLKPFEILAAVDRQADVNSPDFDLGETPENGLAILSCGAKSGTDPVLASKLQSSPGVVRGSLDYTTAGETNTELREGATTNVKLAATFTQSGARSIKHAYLMLRQNGTVTAGKNIWVEIHSDDGGDPDGTAIGTSGTVEAATLDTGASGYSWVKFTFGAPVDLADSTVYHLVLDGDYDASGTNNVEWRGNAVAGSAGNSTSFDDTNWTADADLSFEIYLEEYHFTDVANGAFADLDDAIGSEVIRFRNFQRYVRAVTTIGGTSTPKFTFSIFVLGEYKAVN